MLTIESCWIHSTCNNNLYNYNTYINTYIHVISKFQSDNYFYFIWYWFYKMSHHIHTNIIDFVSEIYKEYNFISVYIIEYLGYSWNQKLKSKGTIKNSHNILDFISRINLSSVRTFEPAQLPLVRLPNTSCKERLWSRTKLQRRQVRCCDNCASNRLRLYWPKKLTSLNTVKQVSITVGCVCVVTKIVTCFTVSYSVLNGTFRWGLNNSDVFD